MRRCVIGLIGGLALVVSGLSALAGGPAANAVGPALRVDAVGYVPAAYDPAIPEYPRKAYKNWDFGNPDLGGILTVVVANDGDTGADVTGVEIDGAPLEGFLAGTCQLAGLACTATPPQEMAWARWLPGPRIPAHGAAVFQLKRTTDAAGSTIEILAGGSTLSVTQPTAGSPIRLGLAYRDRSDAVVVVRNDGAAAASIEGVRLGGSTTAFSTLGGQSAIGPGRTAIVRIPGGGPTEGTQAAITVRTSRGDATTGVRLFTPFFPIGNWITDGWNDPAFLDDARSKHIDTSWGYDWTVPIAREYGFKLVADAVPCAPGQTSGCIAEPDEDVVAAYAYGDEVEFGHSAQEVLANVERRRIGGDRPTYINNAAQRIFQVFAGQADVGAMDHYTSAIGLCTITTAQPSSMQGQPVEWAGNYTRYLKLNTEPNPNWVWSQAGNQPKSCWHGNPTVGEMRAQLFSELANGAKGIMWFIFGSYADVTPSPGLWDEAGALGATLDATRGWLKTGDLDPGALASAPPKIEAGVVSAPRAVVVPVTNLEYRLKPKGYVWSVRDGLRLGVRMPAWFSGTPMSAWQVRAGTFTRLASSRSGDTITVTIPRMREGTVLVFRPAAV
jgi:hypothetical protein